MHDEQRVNEFLRRKADLLFPQKRTSDEKNEIDNDIRFCQNCGYVR
jgi:hypothetical protein